MYEPLLFAHSWIRWVVVLAGIYLIIRLISGSISNRIWNDSDEHLTAAFGQILAYQLIVGFLLYLGLSPVVKTAFLDPAESLKNPLQAYWLVYHGLAMITALATYEIGRRRAIKASSSKQKYIRMLFVALASFSLVVAAIPWPFLYYGRSWIRIF